MIFIVQIKITLGRLKNMLRGHVTHLYKCVTFMPALFLKPGYWNDVFEFEEGFILSLSQKWLGNTLRVTFYVYLYPFDLPRGYSKQLQRCHTLIVCDISNGIVAVCLEANFPCCSDTFSGPLMTNRDDIKKKFQHFKKPVLN